METQIYENKFGICLKNSLTKKTALIIYYVLRHDISIVANRRMEL